MSNEDRPFCTDAAGFIEGAFYVHSGQRNSQYTGIYCNISDLMLY